MPHLQCPRCGFRPAAIGVRTGCPRCRLGSGAAVEPVALRASATCPEAGRAATARAFKLSEQVSWPECLEVLIEGGVDRAAATELEGVLERAADSDHLYVIVDLERCQAIDIGAAKHLVVAYQQLSSQGRRLMIFGARAGVRHRLEAIEAFDARVLIADPDKVVADPLPVTSRSERAGGTRTRLRRGLRSGRDLIAGAPTALRRSGGRRGD